MRRLLSNLLTCRIGCKVGQDFYERAERASNDYNFHAIDIPYITLHIFPALPNFVSDFGPHVALYYVEILLLI